MVREGLQGRDTQPGPCAHGMREDGERGETKAVIAMFGRRVVAEYANTAVTTIFEEGG
jgi:hypothetical protein